MLDSTTEKLVDYALAAEFSELPGKVAHECKRKLIDTFACAVGAYDEPLSAMARRSAERCGGNGVSARMWGSPFETTPEMAAFANGVMLRALDLSDMYRVKSGGHPSDVIAAVWAAAEVANSDGPSVINAIALAYDVYCGFCESIDINSMGWDQPVYGIVASVLGAGKLLGLTKAQMAHALSMSLVPGMALLQARRGELSEWKGCAAANASRNAVFSALLARDGWAGPVEVFQGSGGVFNITGPFDWKLRQGTTEGHGVLKTHLKSFPACYHVQSAASAAIGIRNKVDVERVLEITVETYKWAYQAIGRDPSRWAPATRETADHSFPYVVAVSLLDGTVTTQSFAEDRLGDARIKKLMERTKVLEDPDFSKEYPDSAYCRLTVKSSPDETIETTVRYPKGHVNNNMTDSELESKFKGMFEAFGNYHQCKALLDGLWNIDTSKNVRDIATLLHR